MGYALRRWLRDLLGPDIKGLKRAIALEIADDARYDDRGNYEPEAGRCSRVSLAELVRWTGAKDERTVREELRRLSLAGWEFRKPIGTGKDGRTLYAVPGRSMEFRVPEGPTPVVSEGPTTVAFGEPAAPEGPTVVAEGPTTVVTEATVVASEATTVGPPSLVTASPSSLSSPATGATQDEREIDPLIQKLMNDHDATEDEATALLEQVRAEGRIKSLASWASSATGQLDIKQRLYALRASARDSPDVAGSGLPDWCTECNEGDPAARFNPKFRYRHGQMCHCHPDHKDAAA